MYHLIIGLVEPAGAHANVQSERTKKYRFEIGFFFVICVDLLEDFIAYVAKDHAGDEIGVFYLMERRVVKNLVSAFREVNWLRDQKVVIQRLLRG